MKVGLITTLSGPLAAQFKNVDRDFKARIDKANDEDELGGRRIEAVVVDDQGTPQGNAAAARKLVERDKAVAVAVESPFVSGGARYLARQKVPVVGGPYSGQVWGQRGYENMFGTWGSPDPSSPVYSTYGTYMKQAGAHTVGAFGFGNSPASKVDAESQAKSARAAGLKVGVVDVDAQIGSQDFGPQALAAKDKRVDYVFTAYGAAGSAALLQAAKQSGADVKGGLIVSGYSRAVLGTDAATALTGVDVSTYYTPQELGSAATKAIVAQLKKSGGFADGDYYGFDILGWIAADLAVKGLQAAGSDISRASFTSGLRKVKDYDAGGMLPGKVDFTAFGRGTAEGLSADGCVYMLRLEKDAYAMQNGGKPVCGKKIS
ncbi:ABC transporter substrate-binding protein [Streptomyces sp. NPDC055400]